MSSKLPLLSGRQVVQAFERLGWQFVRQKGSHMMLTRPGSAMVVSIPDHREVDRALLRAELRKAEISIESFLEAVG